MDLGLSNRDRCSFSSPLPKGLLWTGWVSRAVGRTSEESGRTSGVRRWKPTGSDTTELWKTAERTEQYGNVWGVGLGK